MEEKLKKWRLILGEQSDATDAGAPMEDEAQSMDAALEALYDSDRQGSLGSSSPNINRWLGDIRKYFPKSMVQMMQKDALARLGLKQLLSEPELLDQLEPDVELIATLLQLKEIIPDKTRETARALVRKLAAQVEANLRVPLQKAIKGAVQRAERISNPKPREIDWHLTIRRNLKHYQKEYKTIVPESLVGHSRKKRALKEVFILTDQSGSMASSVVYAGILASVMATVPSVKTRFIVFDTNVVDLTEDLHDPVELLFGVQLGGGTDITKALNFVRSKIDRPKDSLVFLISDLFEGVREEAALQAAARIIDTGSQMITLLALNDEGSPAYNTKLGRQFANLGIPSFACTPDQFPMLVAAAIEGRHEWPIGDGLVKKE
ncbi:MAG: VWA domain-containing protein [Saprospiraceae bacterium]|nr:VWA domain-containing protein [Saprospiraceae bacterium]